MKTMADVAEKAGVARSTVSHVLGARQNENVRIPEATRQRILDAAHEIGFRPNALARSVRSGKSRMIGYLVNDPHYEPYWNTIIGALAEAERHGHTLKLMSVTTETLAERVRQCMELRLSGLIVRVSQDKTHLLEEAGQANVPLVTVDEVMPLSSGAHVASDDGPGCRAAIAHLRGLGHRKIGFVSSGFSRPPLELVPIREGLFLQEMAAHKLAVPDGYVQRETMSVYGTEAQPEINVTTALAATDGLLDHAEGRPTAIFCWRDETALVAMQACRRRGLRIPEDVSIVGFSDISAARLSDPPLSTCQSPWEEMGRTAVRELVRVQEEELVPSPQSILIPAGFVGRRSSGPAPAVLSVPASV